MLIMQKEENSFSQDPVLDLDGNAMCLVVPSPLLLVEAHQVLDVLVRTEEHGQPLVNAGRLDVQDSLGTRRGGSTGLLTQVGHGEGLVQDPQLSVLGLGVTRVSKDSSVQQGSVDVGHHGTNVSRAVRAPVILGVLDRFHCEGVKIFVRAISTVLGPSPRITPLSCTHGTSKWARGSISSFPR